MLHVLNLQKSQNKKSKKTKSKTGGKKSSDLPEGGVWRTIRGAKVYIKDGKIIAGAEGKLSDFDMKEITAIHKARQKKQAYDKIIFHGTEVKVDRERKVGKVVGETKTTFHIDYGDGKIRKVAKSRVRRADAYRLKLEEKTADGGNPVMLSGTIDSTMTEDKQKRYADERKEMGAIAKTDEEWASGLLKEQPFSGIRAPLLKRETITVGGTTYFGQPVKEPVVDENGNPVIDPYTGQPKMRYVTYEAENATEEDLLRDHQGLLINEVVNPYAKRYGLEYIQRQWRDDLGNPTDLYGDLVQTANIGYIYGLREYAAKAAKGEQPPVSILTHALMRSRQHVKRQAQDIFSDVKLPEKLLAPLSIVNSLEKTMEQKLGRKPTVKEMVDGIEGVEGLKDNPTFNELKMKSPPGYRHTAKGGEFTAGEDIKDPYQKLEAIYAAKRVQHASSLEGVKTAGGNERGDKEVTLKDAVADEREPGADKKINEAVAKQEVEERAKQLKKEVKKLLNTMLDDREVELIMHRFGIGQRKAKGLADLESVAAYMGISVPLAKKISASAMKKLKNAPEEQMERLRKLYMVKSLYGDGLDILMKAIYVMDLQKSLEAFGLAEDDLEPRQVRIAYGSADEIKKSLEIIEFIGSVISVEGTDRLQARIIEYDFPVPGSVISKAFSKKADPADKNAAIKKYVTENRAKYEKLAEKQHSEFSGKYQGKGEVPWSVRLLLDNPGTCWITWHGDHILIHGTHGTVLYDSSNKRHREKHHPQEDKPQIPHDASVDHGHEAVAEEMKAFREKWKGVEKPKINKQGQVVLNRAGKPQMESTGGYINDWREEHKKDFKKAPKNKINKQFPSGQFLLKNPYTGKQIVINVELLDAGTAKARTAVTYAFDPEADEKINIGNWPEIYRHLYGGQAPKSAYEYLLNDANLAGKHKLQVLTEDEYNELYKGTTEGARASMVHSKITEVTPETMKIMEPVDGKMRSKVVPYKGNRIYEADLGNDRVARFEINEDGQFSDPVMQKLINPAMPIRDANDLYKALRDAIGNEAWVTISSSKRDQLNHHVKLKYDGQGAPVVVGGAFAGYRFQDASEVDDPEEKKMSLFRGGQPVRPGRKQTEKREVPFEIGNTVRIRNPQDRRRWVDARIVEKAKYGKGWVVELPPELTEKGISFKNGANIATLSEDQLRKKMTKYNIATEAPVIDTATGGMLNITVPEQMRDNFEANYDIALDSEGRANISINQFMNVRDAIGSFSLTNEAKKYLEDFYAKQRREGMPDVGQLLEKYNPNNIAGFKDESFLKQTNIYNSQAEGIEHLVQAGKGIAGHGMGTGKTLIGVVGSMYLRDQALKEGRKPGKTLVVSPAGIQSEWLKEINRHTNVGAVVIGSNSDHGSKFGQKTEAEDLRSRVIGFDKYKPDHPEHFAVASYEQFMKNPRKFAKWAQENGFENIVIDEVHAFKTKGGNRNNALLEISPNFKNVWGLSGTPMDNNVTDIYHLVNAVTGGKHDLGSEEEFNNTYLFKEGGKIAGMNESKLDELGQKMAKYAHFRNGYHDAVTYVDPASGEKKRVQFPEAGNNRYHGQLSHVMDFERKTTTQGGTERHVNVPKPQTEIQKKTYERYKQLEARYLSETQRQALEDVATSGIEREGGRNYLPAVHKLQQFLNAPHSENAYWEPKVNSKGEVVGRVYPHKIDANGHKRYYKAEFDEKGNIVGKTGELLPPMHHDNPKAAHLKSVILDHLQQHEKEMARRMELNSKLKPGEKPYAIYPPKMVFSSGYTTFGTDVIENVLRDIQRDTGLTYGKFTGDSSVDRESDKTGFQRNPNQAFMIISDAGKEGIDLGNAHVLVHYDQDFNPNKMAQKTARILRSDSWKHAEREDRPNTVQIKSIAMPGTIEDTIIRAQARKMEDIEKVERATRKVEGQATESDYATPLAGSQRKWAQKKKKVATKEDLKVAAMPLVTTRLRTDPIFKEPVPLVVPLGRRH